MKKLLISILVIVLTFIMFACEGLSESNIKSDDNENIKVHTESMVKYLTFEELLESATDILKGKCIDISKNETYIEYKFSVTEHYMGEKREEIFVCVPKNIAMVQGKNFSYDTEDISYNINDSYFLVLTRFRSVFYEHDMYLNVGANLFLPVDDLSKASIYGDAISMHSNAKSQKILSSKETFTEFFKNYENNAPAFYGTDYVKSNDTNTIIKSSDFLLKIKILDEVYPGMVDDRNTFNCLVVTSFKGDVEEKSIIEIVFPKGSVTQGNEYCVALYEIDNCSPRAFVVSSKYSVFDKNKFDNYGSVKEPAMNELYQVLIYDYSDSDLSVKHEIEYVFADYEKFKDAAFDDNIEIQVNDTRYSGKYQASQYREFNFFPVYQYVSEGGLSFEVDESGMLTSCFWGNASAHGATKTKDECIAIACDFLENIVAIDCYEIDVVEDSERGMYTVSFTKKIGDFETTDTATITIKSDGSLYSYSSFMLGKVIEESISVDSINLEKIKESIDKKLSSVYQDVKNNYSQVEYSKYNVALTTLKDGNLGAVCTVNVEFIESVDEFETIASERISFVVLID